MVDPRTVVPGLIDSTRVLAFTPEEAIKFNYCEGKVQSVSEILSGEGITSYDLIKVEKNNMDKVIGFLALSGTLEPNCWVDITETMERKIDALFRHESQLTETGEWFRDFLRQSAEEAGRAAGVGYAEGFRRLTLG
jgi:hypothetical protein